MNLVVSLGLGLLLGWLASQVAGRFVAESRFGLLGDLVAGAAGSVVGALLVNRMLVAAVAGSSMNPLAIVVPVLVALLAVVVLRVAAGDLGRRFVPVTALTEAIRLRLSEERGVTELAAAPLRMMQQRGQYAARTVTYFQIFDPKTVLAQGADLLRPDTIDSRSFLHSGFVESDGRVVLNQAPRPPIVRESVAAL